MASVRHAYFLVKQYYLVLSAFLAMQSSQWTVFLAICLQGPLPLGCLADWGRGIPRVSVIVCENARLETSYLGPSTESFDGPTYYPAYFPLCVEATQ